jgi:transcriptional regulator with XRE-family HTH domain
MKLRLKDLREDHDLSQRELSEFLYISQVTYSYYEIGKRGIPIDILYKLADYYHTSIDYLTYRTDEKKAYPACNSKKV